MDEIATRADAVAWATAEAERILAGEFGGGTELFNEAQRIYGVLTRFQWLDDDYPNAIVRFVEGWNVSGRQVDEEILQAAAAIVYGARRSCPARNESA